MSEPYGTIGNYPIKISEQSKTFSSLWRIEHFNANQYYGGETIESPVYLIGPEKELAWRLLLYPKGDSTVPQNTFISIHPVLRQNTSTKPIRAKFQIFIDGSEKHVQSFSVFVEAKQLTKLPVCSEFVQLSSINQLLQYHYNRELKIRWTVNMNYEMDNSIPEYVMQHLSRDYEALFRDQKHSDVIFVVQEKKISAHKSVLASRSSVFAAMFDHEMREKKNNVVNITDIDSDVFEDFLRFLYSGKSNFLGKGKFQCWAVCALLSTADKYDVASLKKVCENRLELNLTVDNACEILSLANVHGVDSLKKTAINFINENASSVVRTAGWEEMLNTAPIRLVSDIYVAKVGKK